MPAKCPQECPLEVQPRACISKGPIDHFFHHSLEIPNSFLIQNPVSPSTKRSRGNCVTKLHRGKKYNELGQVFSLMVRTPTETLECRNREKSDLNSLLRLTLA